MKENKTVVIVQARTGSTRLPGKIFLELAGKPLLVRMMERVTASESADEYIIATTTDREDDGVYKLCRQEGLKCFRGHPSDLLERHYSAALEYKADSVVKIPSDCPLIDSLIIKKVIEFYKTNKGKYDYVSNLHPPTYPDGNDVEVLPLAVLEKAYTEALRPFEREHTTPYVWDNPSIFRIGNVEWEKGLDYSMSHRFTIDYSEDYEFIRRVYEELYAANPLFTMQDILDLLERKPDIKKVNEKYAGVNWYRKHMDELKTISKDKTKFINE